MTTEGSSRGIPGLEVPDPLIALLERDGVPAVIATGEGGLQVERSLPDELSPPLERYLPLVRRLGGGAHILAGHSSLVDEAVGLWARPGFETFVSLPRLRFEPFPYQLRAAERVLRHMHGRAVLADEVGLGKTIEALLIASELRLRGLASRILVLAPPGIVEQWGEELDRKFALPWVLATPGRRDDVLPAEEPIVVASLASARRDPLRGSIASAKWDLVIADEAHRLKNPQSASARLVRSLRTRYLLLLTATPVENRLADLFQLTSLVRPGHLGTPREFAARYGAAAGDGRVRDPAGLRATLREVMVRHRRSEVALDLPRRLAETLRLTPAADEAELYRLVSDRVRREGRDAAPARSMALRVVQRLAGSGPRALRTTLEKMGWADLAELAGGVQSTAKGRALGEVLRRHTAAGEKVIVFCAFRETLDDLADLVREAGLPTALYHGSLGRIAKEETIRAFRDDVPTLLTTEAAGEGRNLQFCHVMVNFDLPWNPMQIEQRLGRIHRIGQNRDVLLTNLVTAGTVEDHVLRVLEAKINLFELVVGELDMILGRVSDDFDFEDAIFSAHVASRDDTEFGARLEALGQDLAGARREHIHSRERMDGLAGASEEESV